MNNFVGVFVTLSDTDSVGIPCLEVTVDQLAERARQGTVPPLAP